MGVLRLFGRRREVLGRFGISARIVAVGQDIPWLRFLLVALGWSLFALVLCGGLLLSFGGVATTSGLVLLGSLNIERSGVAAMAAMIEVIAGGILGVVWVEAFDMLPCLAVVAKDGIAIVVSIGADAVDRVVLVSRRFSTWQEILLRADVLRIDGLTRSHVLRRERQMLFCHSLAIVASRRDNVSEDEVVVFI